MQTYRLPADAALRPDPPDTSWRKAYRGPRTIGEVLADASAEMDAQDRAGDMNVGPVRPSLLRRLFRR